MNKQKLEISTCSLLGDRKTQQDSCRYETKDGKTLAVVCDGMGGMAGGEAAARAAVSCIFERFAFDAEIITPENTAQWFAKVFQEADAVVTSLTDSSGNMLHGGTTVVGVMIQNKAFHWGSVGDSRIYYLQRETLHTLTRSHNYNLQLDELVRTGEITSEEREAEGRRGEALISYLGIGGLQLIDTSIEAVSFIRGDVLVLCSDGIYKSLSEEQIQAILEESGRDCMIMSKRLCSNALRIAHRNQIRQDNTTAIVIQSV